MQVYWPKMTRDSLAGGHELFQTQGDPVTLVRPIYERLAGLRGSLFEEGPLTRAAAATLAQVQRQERREIRKTEKRLAAVEAARQELLLERDTARQRVLSLQRDVAEARGQLSAVKQATGAEPNPADRAAWDELAANWQQAEDDNQRLRERLQAAEQRIEVLEDDVRLAHENMIWAWQAQNDPAPAPPEPAADPADGEIDSVTAALHVAAAEYPDVLCVWEDALRSAADSRFASPAQVLRALRAISEVGRLYFKALDGGPPLGPVDRALSAHVPFKYAGFESPTTLRLFGSERVFHDGQRSQQMQRHLTLGGGQTNHCLQIYFDFDDASRRVLIGYCGRHLPYCRQRS